MALPAVILMAGRGGAADVPLAHPVDQFYDVAVSTDRQLVVIVGAWGTILRSADGGQSFARTEVEHGMTALFSVEVAPDGRSCVVTGERGYLGTSDDGCVTIRRVPLPDNFDSVALLRVRRQARVLAVAGDNGTLLLSRDGGRTWQARTVGQLTYFDVQFVNEREGWAVGEFETILHTVDGGDQWTATRGGDPMELNRPAYFALAFTDARHGIVAGLGTAIETADGGATWSELQLPPGSSIIGADGTPDGALLLVGLRGAFLIRRPDGEWTQVRQTHGWLSGVRLAGSTGYAVGGSGTVLATGDGGATWRRLFTAGTPPAHASR